MSIDVSVRYETLHRGPGGSVVGKVELRVSGSVLGQNFDIPVDARNFDFPRGSEQAIYDQDFSAGSFSVKVTATVHERRAGQCCLQGHVHVSAPIGGGVGKDLDENCQAIPE